MMAYKIDRLYVHIFLCGHYYGIYHYCAKYHLIKMSVITNLALKSFYIFLYQINIITPLI
jgi:hypothetical protein